MIEVLIDKALANIEFLSNQIGGRGSCTPEEKQAGEYVASKLTSLGIDNVRVEAFRSIPSTYWPYTLAFTIVFLGTSVALLSGERFGFLVATVLNSLGAWAMFAEIEFKPHWVRWLLPKANSQNVIARIPPTDQVQRRVVLCAHLDTHRTPIFFASTAWHRVFSFLVGLTFLSVLVGIFFFSIASWLDLGWARWISIFLLPVQAFALILCMQADFTPYSPGANDNASGVATLLALVEQVSQEPLKRTEVNLVFTGCEEVGAYGMSAYLDAHALELGYNAVYIVLDEVGLGVINYLTADGLVLKHKTHPQALKLARQVATKRNDLEIKEIVGIAYTDALPATKRGQIALTICTLPASEDQEQSHWHQMSDTIEFVNRTNLTQVYEYTWELLSHIDKESNQLLGFE